MKAFIISSGICIVITGIATKQEWLIAVGGVLAAMPLAVKV